MHEEYGRTVRINLHKLSMADPELMDKLFPMQARKVERWSRTAAMFGSYEMTVSAVGHNLHRIRRGRTSDCPLTGSFNPD